MAFIIIYVIFTEKLTQLYANLLYMNIYRKNIVSTLCNIGYFIYAPIMSN